MHKDKIATLILDDGSIFQGFSFGYEKEVKGEVVFNTAMTGYPESLTDPSYAGQMIVSTYPLVGNYGVPPRTFSENGIATLMESEKIHAEAIIISDYSHEFSHWNAVESLGSWLKDEQVTGIYGIDTRALTKKLREHGVMMGKIVIEDNLSMDNGQRTKDNGKSHSLLSGLFGNYEEVNYVEQVSTKEVITYGEGEGKKRVVLIDCGVKHNIIRSLLNRDVTVIRVPWNYDFTQLHYDGLFISNGPGDPDTCVEAVEHIRKALDGDKPICGICMGNQLLAKAGGASIFKLKYGHRSHNQPVRMVGTERCFITSQNHGYAVDNDSLGADWEPLFINMNDGTNEGIRHKTKPFFSAQFHPEACSGPTDTEFIFDLFVETLSTKQLTIDNGQLTINKNNSSSNNCQLSTVHCQLDKHFPKKVLVLGSGALKIGEAGEFDYSGSQALKAIKEEGIETILINPNIATVQTSEGIADRVYFLPVTPFFVEKVIEKERPEGILLAFGGQTALNCGVALYRNGILEKYNVRVLGTPVQAIIDTEDRELFVRKLDEIDVKTIKSEAVDNLVDARRAAAELGYPVIIRAAYALGGLGSGFCDNEKELDVLAEKAFSFSPQVLVEKSLKGWKEVEYEVVRDKYDNCITVCNMENFDPLGIHTGESIVIAPSQTLSNTDYHKLRELAIKIIRHIGIVGECNVQYAYDPESEDYRVIEVNARLSRSSALASKATGYPLAFVAAKLGLGYGLFELKNSVTKTTSAFFEPALDYVVCKIPRWDLGKFHGVARELGSSMKSVGEVMAIGRTFEEAIQKGLRMIGLGMHGFVENKELVIADIDKALREPTDRRIFVISKAFRAGYTIDQIHDLTKIDRWFLQKLYEIIRTADRLARYDTPSDIPMRLFRHAKMQGFSDFQIARALFKEQTEDLEKASLTVRKERESRHILPVVKQIDTLAAEYPAQTNYLYLTYSGIENDINYQGDKRSIVVLGSGAYRIGSSVEFDWCSVQALNTIRKEGWRSVMINYNPETVSTDYDMCDRLYFDELTFERVMDILNLENPHGVIVSTGGQIPNNLAMRLDEQRVHILGTSAKSIDNAEDREKFSIMLDRIGVDQPRWKELSSLEDINQFVDEVGFPVLVRPSYVLSGAAMNVCSNQEELERFLQLAANVSKKHPVVVSQFIEYAKEIEVDAVADKGEIVMYAISEHIEFAGVHSGDATIQFPAQKLYVETVRRIKRISKRIAKELNISGPFNIQYLAKGNEIKVIECNLRASRSFPFVSKVLKINFIELATQIMLGLSVEKPAKNEFDLDYVGIKASQFSFNRLQKADPVLGVDMASTGEVGCLGDDLPEAILTSMLSVGHRIPEKGILLSTGSSKQKVAMLDAAKILKAKGYILYATGGTYRFLEENNIPSTKVYWPSEEGQPQALDLLRDKQIDMVVNIPRDLTARELSNGYTIRRAAIDLNIPLITNTRLASAFIEAFCSLSVDDIQIKSWQEYK
ncbi:carbamoyl-phosphate synthase (glutamine-hydrolyzing) large subunit [Parabacteroides sp. PF5-9]|uniref:carbamoyl-phosphate synthase (glutamine-hydrolyzing) large subunit n=1 Tax=Parabacteroides sp. PF5-9 TaxID=1742404 RepID=UPI00247DA9DB|nr:carbamoyl-phosphate synthase large subunit [Parabacteroides sp. PF5-9]